MAAWGALQRRQARSTGEHEAVELRDGDKSRYLGKGTLKVVGKMAKRFGRQDYRTVRNTPPGDV